MNRQMYSVFYFVHVSFVVQLTGHHRVFNVPLKNLELTEVKLSNGSVCRIPKFVSDACTLIMEQVEIEGLFRKAGSAARQKEIRVSAKD